MKKLTLVGVSIVILLALLSGCAAPEVTAAKIYIQRNQYDKAIEQSQKAIEKYPNDPEPYVTLAIAHYEKKNFLEAGDALAKAYEIDEKEAEKKVKDYESNRKWAIFYNSAVKYRETDIDKALEMVKRSENVESARSKAYSYNLHGNLLILQEKREEALSYYEKAINTYGDIVDPYLSLGNYYTINKKPEKAVEYFTRAIEVDSTVARVYPWLGQAYLDMEEFEKAINVLEKAKKITDNDPKILYNLALSYFKIGNADRAIENGEIIIGMNTVDPVIRSKTYDLIAQIRIENKEYNEAIDLLETAVMENPNNCEAYHLLAIAYLKINNKTKSSEYADKWDKCLNQQK